MHLALPVIEALLQLGLLAVELWLGAVTLYLVVLVLASFRYRPPSYSEALSYSRIALVVPAHDEESVIERLLASLYAVDYPRDAYAVHVVADNCSDATARLARAAGATVHERHEPAAPGKGQALSWLLQRLPLHDYDAVLIVDADALVSTNLLAMANHALLAGYGVAQFYDGVLNQAEGSAAALRSLAFDLRNRVQLLGKEALGCSVGLMGNGMLIATRCLVDDGWDSFGLAEDVEFHVRLLQRGERVHFLPEASSLAEMPTSLRASASQNRRWEAGRLAAARLYAPQLLLEAVRTRQPRPLAAALDLIAPPQSVQLLGLLACLGLAVALTSAPLALLALALLAGQAVYLGLGLLQLSRAGASLRCLIYAPPYVLWKALLYLAVLLGRADKQWLRGPRQRTA